MRAPRPQTRNDLAAALRRIDRKGYKAYKDIAGRYAFDGFELLIDHVQGDPFGSPSRLRVRVPAEVAAFPGDTYAGDSRAIALRDALARAFARRAKQLSKPRGVGSSGLIAMDMPGQEILERSAVLLTDAGDVEARFVAGLPAQGRTIDGGQAEQMLCRDVPTLAEETLRWATADRDSLRRHVLTAEDADALRGQLAAKGLVAFVADGAILPRRSGVDDRPMSGGAIPFESPESLRVTLEGPNGGPVSGLGVPCGITLIVGGGYHGKSTLLQAIERGVYNHVPDDGRAFVVADPAAVKVRAEDGRGVAGVDISPFINDLPGGQRTDVFSTPNASGSTSQAANIVEALEAGARVLMMDEDTSATNFMIRDRRMQALVAKSQEPITPFVDKVRQLHDDLGVSTVLVIGGSGDYLDKADTVIAMQAFHPADVTAEARQVVETHRTERTAEGGDGFGKPRARHLADTGIRGKGPKPPKVKVQGRNVIRIGDETIDLAAVAQILDESQTRAVAEALMTLSNDGQARDQTLPELLDRIEKAVERQGLDALSRTPRGDLARFRRFELAAALNRLRSLRVREAPA
ncbi:ABC-ATPase domain-containing protein [Ferruginivarius sediminum]|uniref:ATPase n=1 Tax=Ferruginivarius sediminum TaxID=2661937 RepID=A0A369TFZ1_9PROT|nr:ABC-ATPase domain-containing protein [Ferruginivarius sediminum]RDD63305.1 ATPase [Ferruginivarius sediminum]